MSDGNTPPADRGDRAADDIPGRAARRPAWKALLVAAAFAVWLAVLLLVGWLGRP